MADDRPAWHRSGLGTSADEPATLVLTGTIVAVATFVTVAFNEPAATAPFLVLPTDIRRLGVAPRPGERWVLELAVERDGRAIQAVRLVGLSAP